MPPFAASIFSPRIRHFSPAIFSSAAIFSFEMAGYWPFTLLRRLSFSPLPPLLIADSRHTTSSHVGEYVSCARAAAERLQRCRRQPPLHRARPPPPFRLSPHYRRFHQRHYAITPHLRYAIFTAISPAARRAAGFAFFAPMPPAQLSMPPAGRRVPAAADINGFRSHAVEYFLRVCRQYQPGR